MHIFSKKKDSTNVGGEDSGETADVAVPSPKRRSRIHSTTSLSNVQSGEHPYEDTQSASAAVPGHLPAPAPSFPEPTPAPGPAETVVQMATPTLPEAERGEHEDHAPLPAPVPQPTSRFIEDQVMENTAQTHKRTGSLRSTDFTTLSPTMDSSTNLKKSNSAAKLQKKAKRNGSDSTRTDPDSGYDSPSPEKKLAALKKENTEDIEPVPVVWASGAPHEGETAEGGPLEHDREQGPIPRSRSAMDHSPQTGGADVRRSQSMRSNRIAGGLSRNYARDDRESMHTTPSGRHTPRRRKSLTGGSFANGPGMVGPNAKVDDEETKLFRTRSVTAEAALTKKEKSRIGKAETKEGKRVAKVIKEEARAEKKALEQSIRELSDFQKIQKYAVKEEAKTTAAYAQALKAFHKEELAFLAARAKFERAEADLQCHEDARDAAREHASDATEMLQDKNREIEWMRAQKHADDREREIRLRQLAGKPL